MVNPYLTGDKGTCTEKKSQKIRRLTDGKKGENGRRTNEHIHVQTRYKCVLYAQ